MRQAIEADISRGKVDFKCPVNDSERCDGKHLT